MQTTTQNTATQNSLTSMRMVVLFALFVLSSVEMFGQNTKQVVATSTITFEVSIATSDDTVAATQSNVTTNTSMNFVSWFMGTKQTPNANQLNDASNNSKIQMINSGIAPNRLLIKAFLKKATNYSSAIA